MKTVKRILTVILLAVILGAVGYLVFTGRRLPLAVVEDMTETVNEAYEGGVLDETNAETEDPNNP